MFYFHSFLIKIYLKQRDGHCDPDLSGEAIYRRLQRRSKKELLAMTIQSKINYTNYIFYSILESISQILSWKFLAVRALPTKFCVLIENEIKSPDFV